MNYYNPYFNIAPYMGAATKAPGLFSRLLGGGGIKWGSLLSGTQKVLGVANQAIPLIRQVTPVMKNAKTMFKVMNEFKKVDTPNVKNTSTASHHSVEKEEIIESNVTSDGPTFFL